MLNWHEGILASTSEVEEHLNYREDGNAHHHSGYEYAQFRKTLSNVVHLDYRTGDHEADTDWSQS